MIQRVTRSGESDDAVLPRPKVRNINNFIIRRGSSLKEKLLTPRLARTLRHNGRFNSFSSSKDG